ncbi:immune inhibitor A domain-containing protein [Paenisporosarcina cavernae]|uniref:Peptidase M6 n=1 Tax=Paenisporosarcina cavernae TaxID=2320858 RepID=A0A385YPT5_9BACL|nr:immune inhibitor A domain-containing protein [Paenisporosarcina cavernae]AYC28759.1 peptidase M6 [Paenisporosarcina cavernae]
MKKKTWLKVLSTGALAASLFAPAAVAPVEASSQYANFNTEKYGDRMEIDQYLHNLSQDPEFQKDADSIIKKQAPGLADETEASAEASADSNFTYDGGTKMFLDQELGFKDFTLRSVGDNVEVWVANDLSFPDGDPRPAHVVTQEQVDKLRDEFESNIYPKVTDFFGTPDALDGSNAPLPGMVGLPDDYYEGSDKVIMLVDNIIDDNFYDPTYPFFVAGFFWQTFENYIDRNIVTIDTTSWDTRLENTFFGTTIHELQHLIQADKDGAEESFINEGFSTFSEFLGGYGSDASSINFYLDHPENSLVNWDEHAGVTTPPTGPETIADYGQTYLFTLYMYEQFGQDFIKALAEDGDAQGVTSIDHQLKAFNTGLTFQELYSNFMAALALDDGKEGSIYDFHNVDLRDLPVNADGDVRGKTVDFEKALTFEKEGVPAWGGDFKEFELGTNVKNIKFDGVDFLPLQWDTVANPFDDSEQVLHNNAGSEADQALIFGATVPEDNATLTFDHYYNMEEQWDFGMVQVSTDNGETWTSLENENTRSDVVDEGYPTIKENVPGFTGTNDDWSTESFDLSAYAGQDVLVSFRNLTDWGYEEAGWYIKNIQLGDFSSDGSSVDAFKSLGQVKGDYVNFIVTFIHTMANGNQKVINVDPFNVTEQDVLKMKQVLKKGNLKMITSYAAKEGQKTTADFTYELVTKDNGGKAKGKK